MTPSDRFLRTANELNREANAIAPGAAGGAAKTAVSFATQMFDIGVSSQNELAGFVIKPLLESAREAIDQRIDSVTSERILTAGGNPDGIGRALGEAGGVTAFNFAMLALPEMGMAGIEMRGATFIERSAAAAESRLAAHIGGGGRDCIAATADYIAANAGGNQEAIGALRAYINANNVATRPAAVALIEKYTGLTAGEPVAWGKAAPGKYAVFNGQHVVYGEVTPFNYSFT